MIRTHIIPCDLPRELSDSVNRESGRIYTQVCVYHWRTYRKKGIWLSGGAAEKINDSLREKNLLHAHTVDAAQQGFQKALVAARAARKAGFDAKFPHRRKRFRTTVWKNTGIKRQGRKRVLSNGRGNPVIAINLPESREDALRFLEVRLVFDRRARRYFWHLAVENGKQPKQAKGTNVVSVDLGEVHPAVVGDGKEATILACRELRYQKQGHNKRLAGIHRAISRTKKGSRKRRRLYRARTRLRAKHERVVRDMEHKISKAVVVCGSLSWSGK